ncbi:MAG TPA: histidinol dehydrogenase [Candidatus Paceibacterota bacterium]|jgi:histidinol dehydrogenase|nr:histidinol dehydrogenase [Candidatus Paceibacterota bacterium]
MIQEKQKIEECMPIFTWKELQESPSEMQRIFNRNQNAIEGFLPIAREIFEKVKGSGNKAIVELELQYNKKLTPETYNIENLRLTEEEIKKAYEKVGAEGLKTIKEYVKGVKRIGDALMEKEKKDVVVERSTGFTASYIAVPRNSVGIYCPAGQVPLPIVSGMLAQSASCAGVKRIAVFFPPTELDAEIIVAGKEAGATEFYRIGGAQAIAAMTYGTETIQSFEMIVGPGSTITQAGKMIAREKGIFTDAIGGPSEQVILIEDGASLDAIIMATRDILTECEHGETSTGIVITDSEKIAEQIRNILFQFTEIEERKAVIKEALRRASAIIVASNTKEMIDIAGKYGGEHIGLYMRNPEQYVKQVNSTSVSCNDSNKNMSFMSTARANYGGTYHATLPTGPNGRLQPGGTTPKMFLREIEVMEITNEGATIGLDTCEALAKCELLPSHRNAMLTTRILRGGAVEKESSALMKVIKDIKATYDNK